MANEFALLDGPVPVRETGIGLFEAGQAGLNPNVGSGNVPQDIWPVGGIYVFPTVAAAGTIVSTNANDTAAGTGGRTVRIIGLDSNFDTIGETVTLNGLTPVALANSYIRINFANTILAGSTGTNEGDIDIVIGVDTLARIPIRVGTNRAAIYTLPNDFPTLRLDRWWLDLGKQAATQATLELFVRPFGEAFREVLTLDLNSQGTGYINHPIPTRNIVQPKTDILVSCPICSTNNNAISSGFDLT